MPQLTNNKILSQIDRDRATNIKDENVATLVHSRKILNIVHHGGIQSTNSRIFQHAIFRGNSNATGFSGRVRLHRSKYHWHSWIPISLVIQQTARTNKCWLGICLWTLNMNMLLFLLHYRGDALHFIMVIFKSHYFRVDVDMSRVWFSFFAESCGSAPD